MATIESRKDCSNHDALALYRIPFSFNQDIVQSVPGTGEVERVGMQKAEGEFDVVTTTAGFAQALFDKRWGHATKYPEDGRFYVHQDGPPVLVCYIDGIVNA